MDQKTSRTSLKKPQKSGRVFDLREGAQLIEKVKGDYPTIVGLPIWRTAKILEQQGVVGPNVVGDIYRLKPYGNWKDFSR